jgi:hypothetical protein
MTVAALVFPEFAAFSYLKELLPWAKQIQPDDPFAVRSYETTEIRVLMTENVKILWDTAEEQQIALDAVDVLVESGHFEKVEQHGYRQWVKQTGKGGKIEHVLVTFPHIPIVQRIVLRYTGPYD